MKLKISHFQWIICILLTAALILMLVGVLGQMSIAEDLSELNEYLITKPPIEWE